MLFNSSSPWAKWHEYVYVLISRFCFRSYFCESSVILIVDMHVHIFDHPPSVNHEPQTYVQSCARKDTLAARFFISHFDAMESVSRLVGRLQHLPFEKKEKQKPFQITRRSVQMATKITDSFTLQRKAPR